MCRKDRSLPLSLAITMVTGLPGQPMESKEGWAKRHSVCSQLASYWKKQLPTWSHILLALISLQRGKSLRHMCTSGYVDWKPLKKKECWIAIKAATLVSRSRIPSQAGLCSIGDVLSLKFAYQIETSLAPWKESKNHSEWSWDLVKEDISFPICILSPLTL